MIVAIFLVPGRLVRICQNGLLPHANLTSEGIALFNPWEGARRKMAQSRESITPTPEAARLEAARFTLPLALCMDCV
jgi:hypothetical protein